MDLNLLAIAKKASLGKKIVELTELTQKRILNAEKQNSKIYKSFDFSEDEKKFNRELTLIGVVALLEQYLNFIHIYILECFPKKISNKNVNIDLILEEGSLMNVISKKAQEKVTDLAYGKFQKTVDAFKRNLELTGDIEIEIINKINEIKCTRDLFAHTDGKVNNIYLNKTSINARSRKGEKLEIDMIYLKDSIETIRKFINDTFKLIPSKFKDSKKKFIFKQMWEATSLNRVREFDHVWKFAEEEKDMIRPVDIESNFGFSHSEIQIHYFFLDIYCNENRVDYNYLFKRWGPSTNEYQIVQSWLNNPFYF